MKKVKWKKFFPEIRRLRRELKKLPLSEKRLLDKELGNLLKVDKNALAAVVERDNILVPYFGEILYNTKNLDDDGFVRAIEKSDEEYTSSELGLFSCGLRLIVLRNTLIAKELDDYDARKLAEATDLNYKFLLKELDPQDKIWSRDTTYKESDDGTRSLYREYVTAISKRTGISEKRLVDKYLEDKSPFKRLKTEYYLFFPHIHPLFFGLFLLFSALIVSQAAAIFTHPFDSANGSEFMKYIFIAFIAGIIPAAAAIKPFLDIAAVRYSKSRPLARLDFSETGVPENAKTLCVMTVLGSNEKTVETAFSNLRSARLKNFDKNIYFMLLLDASPSKTARNTNDEKIIQKAEELFRDEPNMFFAVRKRVYSKTMREYIGRERKRGGILDLGKFIENGCKNPDEFFLKTTLMSENRFKYFALLDLDTVPLMNSVRELVACAEHPANAEKGIIQPRVTTSLDSYLKSKFSRLAGENGGCAGASAYDAFSGEMYHDAFGDGIFNGKGLVNIREMVTAPELPKERVLSHDVLEGGILGVGYAGDVEFSDGFPDCSSGYFSRMHRWFRGDLQNIFALYIKGIFQYNRADEDEGKLRRLNAKFKIVENVRRVLTPIFCYFGLFLAVYIGSFGLAFLCFAACVSPYIHGFVTGILHGRQFALKRRFYSPVMSETKKLGLRIFTELIFLPKTAFTALSALFLTVVRMFTRRKLLEWKTASAFENTGKLQFAHLILPEIFSVALMSWAFLKFNGFVALLGVIFVFGISVIVRADLNADAGEKTANSDKLPTVNEKERVYLTAEVKKMWQFYSDYVTDDSNNLPPDNVQYAPVFRVCPNTSPTNIGMYLLSVISSYKFGFIDRQETENRLEKTIETVIKLPKYNGHLINWYNIYNLQIISDFVSCVDSGNFICALVAVGEFVRSENYGEGLKNNIKTLITQANFKVFYNENRNLLSIGTEISTGKNSRHSYDLLMSEARMTSYLAIGKGDVPKKHWQALGRTLGMRGVFAAPVAWTGTMFEYFMPELLLKSKRGSLSYEALQYALRSQQARTRKQKIPYGISESGFYAFDENFNYQYKAHGTGDCALKSGMDDETVISPYSTFLTLPFDVKNGIKNLNRIEKLGAFHPRYGFYEAIDFTPERAGESFAVVRSHMAHHVGMSVAAVTNLMYDGYFQKLFLADERAKRAEELLEEKIITGEVILGLPDAPPDKENEIRMSGVDFKGANIDNPKMHIIGDGLLTDVRSDFGDSTLIYKGLDVFYRTVDTTKPRGNYVAFVEGDNVYPLYSHPDLKISREDNGEFYGSFFNNSVEYFRDFKNLKTGVQIYCLSEIPAEVHRFAAENNSGIKRAITLSLYFEPTLMRFKDVSAHPAFADLFLKIRYIAGEKVILVSRKDRNSDKQTFLCIGFRNTDAKFNYSFDRESVVTLNEGIFSSARNIAKINETNCKLSTPAPCVEIMADFTLDANERGDLTMFLAMGDSEEEAIAHADRIRKAETVAPAENVISPLPPTSAAGRIAARLIPHILYRLEDPMSSGQVRAPGTIDDLWKLGISGDYPILVFEIEKGNAIYAPLSETARGLTMSGIRADFVLIFSDEYDLRKAHILKTQKNAGNLFLFLEEQLEPHDKMFLMSAAVLTGLPPVHNPSSAENAVNYKEILNSKPQKAEHAGFYSAAYTITEKTTTVWSNYITNGTIGKLCSERSLGYSWAFSSRENKLSPWENDLRADNKGEKLLLKFGSRGKIYDIVDGATAVFSPNGAVWKGKSANIFTETAVRAFQKGAGFAIDVTLSNSTDKPETLFLAYYIEPVLGVDRTRANLISAGYEDTSLIFKNTANPFNSVLVVTLDKNHSDAIVNLNAITTNREKFLSGDFNFSDVNGNTNLEIPAGNPNIIGAVVAKVVLPPRRKADVRFVVTCTRDLSNPLSLFEGIKSKPFFFAPIYHENLKLPNGMTSVNQLFAKVWLPWQILGGRIWSRTGFYQCGGAYGFRDQLQDAIAALYFAPEISRKIIYQMCSAQFPEGDVLHWFHKMPNGIKNGTRTRYSDDLLWLPYVLAEYITVTRDFCALTKRINFLKGEILADGEHERYAGFEGLKGSGASVYEHAKLSLQKGYLRGIHGLLLIGGGDWCDGYNRVGIEGRGESVWLTMFYIMVARKFSVVADLMNDERFSAELLTRADILTNKVEEEAWNGEYYIRGFYDDGTPLGDRGADCCEIDLLPQAFSVLAEFPSEKRKYSAVKTAYERLCGNNIIRLFTPPFSQESIKDPGYVKSYPAGIRENGGQYTHAAVWFAWAFEKMKQDSVEFAEEFGDKDLLAALLPYDRGEEYKNEPYFVSADIYSSESCRGRGGWSGYTGSAGWLFCFLAGAMPLPPRHHGVSQPSNMTPKPQSLEL